jgi:ADP-ribosyl-[dinitrogen reductase] hydrolase
MTAVMVGLAVGDALGMPFERSRDAVHKDLPGWGGKYRPGTYHKLPAGHWTDDTEMATALAESLIAHEGYVVEDAAKRYLAWAQDTPHGMGRTTRNAMAALANGVPPSQSGVTFENPLTVGNGTAMRVAPLGVWYRESPDLLAVRSAEDAAITHQGPEAAAGSLAIAWAVKESLSGTRSYRLFEAVLERLAPAEGPTYVQTLVYGLTEDAYHLMKGLVPPPEVIRRIGRFGNVSQTVATALFCAAWAADFEQGVCTAIRGGGDTDTRGAITGAILGARFGLEGIPEKYRTGLMGYASLCSLDLALMEGPK